MTSGSMSMVVVMAMVIIVTMTVRRCRFALVLPEERHKERTRAVERGHERRQNANPVHPGCVLPGRFENHVFRGRTGKSRNTGDRQSRARERSHRHRHVFTKPAHVTHVLFVVAAMDDATSSKEEQRFEERVR